MVQELFLIVPKILQKKYIMGNFLLRYISLQWKERKEKDMKK